MAQNTTEFPRAVDLDNEQETDVEDAEVLRRRMML
jgi:hypothetical protein